MRTTLHLTIESLQETRNHPTLTFGDEWVTVTASSYMIDPNRIEVAVTRETAAKLSVGDSFPVEVRLP